MQHPVKPSEYGIPVRITLGSGDLVLGLVFVGWGQQVGDILTAPSSFLPVKTLGHTRLVAKSAIMYVDVLTLDEIAERQELFPDLDFASLDPC